MHAVGFTTSLRSASVDSNVGGYDQRRTGGGELGMSTKEVLHAQRRVLLDLTYRNRLLSLPKKPSSCSIVVYDELSAQVVPILLDKKSMSFVPLPGGAEEEVLPADEAAPEADEPILTQPDDEIDVGTGLAVRHTDTRLQTKLKSEHLQKRLLEIFYESHTMLEEQGVNVLYLALGQLRFRERPGSDEFRLAPLVLLPVALERKTARERFKLKWTEEDPQENLSLREKLRTDFGMKLPEFPEMESFDIGSYFAEVREVISSQEGWQVIDDGIQLGFFSFAKLLMFLDLDPANWPQEKQIDANPLVAGLLGEGFNERDVGVQDVSQGKLDHLIPVEQLKHVMDCDSSQALAVEAVRSGQNLVIQGPPGTGKSQTIANVIATAVGDGKRVLFVAEKMAALDVVKRRLENVGLGPLCLELHSNKANKKTVLEELDRTMNVGRPAQMDVGSVVWQLDKARTSLNAHAAKLHAAVGTSVRTPFQIMGMLTKLLASHPRPTYQLKAATTWSMHDANARAKTITELCCYLPKVGDPGLNPWRGVQHPPVMRPRAEDMVGQVAPLVAAHEMVLTTADTLGRALGITPGKTLAEIAQQSDVARNLADAPAFDKSTITSSVWSAGLDSLREAIRKGRVLIEVRRTRSEQVIESAWATDWVPERKTIAGKGESLFRWLSGPYREAINNVRGVMRSALPKEHAARLALLDDLIAGNNALKALQDVSGAAKAAFGTIWRDEGTDWALAESIVHWVEQQAGIPSYLDARALAPGIDDTKGLMASGSAARDAVDAFTSRWASVANDLRLDVASRYGSQDVRQVELTTLGASMEAWRGDVAGFLDWLNFNDVVIRAQELGLGEIVAGMGANDEPIANAEPQFWIAFYLEMLNLATVEYPELAKFDGRKHEQLVHEFRDLDKRRLAVAQFEAAQAHFEAAPTDAASIGAVGILRSEIKRKRGHMALRKLFKRCGSPIQALKPVFMMSPLSVAQFLEPGAIEFDLLVIDEASQVEPVDALGAIARCKKIVVVGDDKQLPPTSFFSRITGGDEVEEEEEGPQAKDLESILSLCSAKGLPQRMLQWHYRSRHESLIAVSNKEFYDGELFIVPSPDRDKQQSGLRFHFLADGRFDRGNTQKNHVEAVSIAKAVLDHSRIRPEHSLGIGAMSVRQRQAISDEIELLRREHPEMEQFISQRHPNEPFFVKNLENIQGDERDVIMISIGYGRSKSDDKMYQNFGPLNADGGQRRLNVLISRAKQRCEVFSSITAEDIRIDERSKKGVIALKTFLKYAETGILGVPVFTGKAADSPFEEAVQEVLVKYGLQVDNQVGVAGFFIDLAVVDPETPGRYLMGLECDGATYHSAPSARDRDRLRQEILEAHGWTIHRIWSTDWFQRCQSETDRLLRAISAAKASQRATHIQPNLAIEPQAHVGVARERAASRNDEVRAIVPAYVQADFKPGNGHLQPHDVPVASMAFTVGRIISEEGPLHFEEIVARVRDLWGLGRAGSRIQAAVRNAIRHEAASGVLLVESDCYMRIDSAITVRDRSNAASRSLKKPELLPPQEVREAVLQLVRSAHGVGREEVVVAVARTLGFQATSLQLRDRILGQVELLVDKALLSETAGELKATVQAIH